MVNWGHNSLQGLLERYLNARGSEEPGVREALAAGIYAEVCRRVARHQLQNADDVISDCFSSLLSCVDEIKRSGVRSIGNLDAYVGITVENHVKDEFRRANPERRRLGLGIEHVLSGGANASGFSLWSDSRNGARIAGFDKWRGRPARGVSSRFEDPMIRTEFAKKWLDGLDSADVHLPDLIAAILNWHKGPMALDDLVDVACALRGVARIVVVSWDEPLADGSPVKVPTDPKNDPEQIVVERMSHRHMIERTWACMRQLAPHQIAAICLKCERDELVSLIAVAGRSAFEQSLGINADDLDGYLAEVPLQDDGLAAILGLEAKQIPGVRMKARQRLARNLVKDADFAEL